MKIQTKILLITLLLFMVAGTAIIVVNHFATRNMTEDDVYDHMSTTAESRASHIETYLDGGKKAIKQLSESIVIERLLLAGKDDPDYSGKYNDAIRRLKHTAAANEYIYGVFVLDKDGTIIASSEEIDIGKDKSSDPYFLGGKEGVFIKDAYTSRNREIDSIAFSAPIFDEEATVFLGVIVIRLSMEKLDKITTGKAGLREGEEFFLVNKDDYMITPSRFLNDTFLKQKVETFHSGGEPEDIEHLAGYGHEVILCKNYRGVEVLRIHVHIPEIGWCLMAETSTEYAFAPLA